MENVSMPGKPWSREETLAAFNLYCRTPFGRLHSKNPEIIQLSKILGRSANSVAMKCGNLASFDPALRSRGIKGLSKASRLDYEIWESFEQDPEQTGFQSESQYAKIMNKPLQQAEIVEWHDIDGLDREAITKVRVNQYLFRSIILSSYREECAICKLPVLNLLVACHIVPWSVDLHNRMNPHNGICLCSLHDRAYETGIVLIDEHFVVRIGKTARCYRSNDAFMRFFVEFEGNTITLPDRWHPDPVFLQRRCVLVS
jgi:predicted restriction endonuclease